MLYSLSHLPAQGMKPGKGFVTSGYALGVPCVSSTSSSQACCKSSILRGLDQSNLPSIIILLDIPVKDAPPLKPNTKKPASDSTTNLPAWDKLSAQPAGTPFYDTSCVLSGTTMPRRNKWSQVLPHRSKRVRQRAGSSRLYLL